MRVGVIHNPSTAPNKETHWLARAVYAAQETQNRNFAKNFITKLLKENNYDSISKGSTKVQDFEVNVSTEIFCFISNFFPIFETQIVPHTVVVQTINQEKQFIKVDPNYQYFDNENYL